MAGIRLVVTHATDGATLSQHAFDRDSVTLGRVAGNDLVLHDVEERISSRHARLERRDGGWWLSDLGSTNGTLVNDRRIAAAQPVRLAHGDRIRLGDFVVHFTEDADPVAAARAKLDPRSIESEAGGSPTRAWEIFVARYRELFGPR